jgi:hypothetical protein
MAVRIHVHAGTRYSMSYGQFISQLPEKVALRKLSPRQGYAGLIHSFATRRRRMPAGNRWVVPELPQLQLLVSTGSSYQIRHAQRSDIT